MSRAAVWAVVLVAGFLLSGLVTAVSYTTESAPVSHAAPMPFKILTPSAPDSRVTTASGSTPLVSTHGTWTTSSFFNNIQVTVSDPYVGPFSQFATVPTINTIPMAATGFWLNISTDIPIFTANITIWGNQWPDRNVSEPISGFNPSAPATFSMLVNPAPANNTASFYFNCLEYFWPGSSLGFNLSVTGNPSYHPSPSTLWSAGPPGQGAGQYASEWPAGSADYATWLANVQTPWISPQFNSSIIVSTSPSVLTSPAYEPNSVQTLQIYLTPVQLPGFPTATIPAAQINYTVVQGVKHDVYIVDFIPPNGTLAYLPAPIGPFPNSTIFFNVTAWLPWNGGSGEVDPIYSPIYEFKWSPNGGWVFPDQPLLNNVAMYCNPDILSAPNTVIPAGQPVTCNINEPTPNVTMSLSQINYVFTDGVGRHSGTLPMTLSSANNASSVTIPGLPPDTTLTFFVEAKDFMGNPVFSQNFTYRTSTSPPATLPGGRGLFFFEGLDISGTGLIPNLQFTISNATWSESRNGSSLGFGFPLIPGSETLLLPLGAGAYLLTVTAFGQTQTATVNVAPGNPFTVLFYFASQPIAPTGESNLPVMTVASGGGLIFAAVAAGVTVPWFSDRRAKALAEQRRVTL
ncbi:MAG: hypothetical protein L3K03_00880 [Thermoplasmata archaeon]|nr:hypothetical protein [Thermoplasmata archaeon]